jgi:hypothetical protein
VSLIGTLQNDLDVRLLHRLAQVPVRHQTAAACIVLDSTFSVIEGERSEHGVIAEQAISGQSRQALLYHRNIEKAPAKK